MKSQLLHSNYRGTPLSFVVKNINCIKQVPNERDQTWIFTTGSLDPFTCSEPYELILRKLESCLED